MTKKVGRNDPCPCGSGKKYKNCCESRLGSKKTFQASIISGGSSGGKNLLGKATKISTGFFNRSSGEEPRHPENGEPHHPPEADRPM